MCGRAPRIREGVTAPRRRRLRGATRANSRCVEQFAVTRLAAIARRGTRVAPSGVVARSCRNRVTAFRTHGLRVMQTRAGGRDMSLVNYVRTFVADESGQDLLEYALLVALIALVAFGAVQLAGGQVSTIFTNITNQLKNA
jgi:Flp pilus assembly pilin Flp